MSIEPKYHNSYKAGALIQEHPPYWSNRNKKEVFRIASPPSVPYQGDIDYAEWECLDIPVACECIASCVVQEGVYDYLESSEDNVHWYKNFSDPSLFTCCESDLLAQDELQTTEHPVLVSLRKALLSNQHEPVTVECGEPSPVTISGVQRRCEIDTFAHPGLYGSAFARARIDEIRSATRAIVPPSISNLLCVAALPPEYGEYTKKQLLIIFKTAYSGYTAALAHSRKFISRDATVTIHTGFWGCGAFGGNRTLMTILQIIAAGLAHVNMVFHAFDSEGVQIANDALEHARRILKPGQTTEQIIELLLSENFQWGESDGN